MKMKLGIVLVSFCLLFGGTAIAADQNELPPILASLDHSENVILLDDHSMAQVEGTSFRRAAYIGLELAYGGIFLKLVTDEVRDFKADPRGFIRARVEKEIRGKINAAKDRVRAKVRGWIFGRIFRR